MKIDIEGPVELTLNDDGSADIAFSDTSLHLSREIVNSDMKLSLHKLKQADPVFSRPSQPDRGKQWPWEQPRPFFGEGPQCTGFGGDATDQSVRQYTINDALQEQQGDQLDLPLDFGIVKDVTMARTDMDSQQSWPQRGDSISFESEEVMREFYAKKEEPKNYHSRAGASVYGVSPAASDVLMGIINTGGN